ncbi:hypothetical protein IAR50_005877 [Cryptococcus sp. DSM 104548]
MSSEQAADILFSPLTLGDMRLSHRIAMAPMTRNRGITSSKHPGTFLACPLMEEYYSQRTTEGGLIISEAIPVSRQASDPNSVPGIFTEEQIESWKPVVEAVHRLGGLFVAQLWHAGRTRVVQNEFPIISSSTLPITKTFMGTAGAVPQAMTIQDIERVKEEYAQAAINCMAAGFDAVELHAANGYLPEAFLHSNINKRTDSYGGSPENRNRFVVELSDAIAQAVGARKFSLRLSPFGFFNEARGEQRVAQWTRLCREVGGRGWAYIHFMEPRYDEVSSGSDKLKELGGEASLKPFLEALGGQMPVIVAGGYDCENVKTSRVLEEGRADVVAFGRYFTSNPDLVYRLKHNQPLVQYIRPRFYGPFPDPEIAYSDFPFCPENSTTPERKALLETQTSKSLVVAEPGWQLSKSGVQLRGLAPGAGE